MDQHINETEAQRISLEKLLENVKGATSIEEMTAKERYPRDLMLQLSSSQQLKLGDTIILKLGDLESRQWKRSGTRETASYGTFKKFSCSKSSQGCKARFEICSQEVSFNMEHHTSCVARTRIKLDYHKRNEEGLGAKGVKLLAWNSPERIKQRPSTVDEFTKQLHQINLWGKRDESVRDLISEYYTKLSKKRVESNEASVMDTDEGVLVIADQNLAKESSKRIKPTSTSSRKKNKTS